MISNQTHAHTFTCTKRAEKQCRFNIPYWPMWCSRVLLPLSKEDQRRDLLKQKVADVRSKLETKTYDSIQIFLRDINCDSESYLTLIRSTSKRPTLIFKRDPTQIFVNTFNPWIATSAEPRKCGQLSKTQPTPRNTAPDADIKVCTGRRFHANFPR